MIDAEIVERFHRDGAACIRQLFRPGEIALLRTGIDENLAHLSPRAKVASAADDPGIRRGLLQLAGQCGLPALHLRIGAA